MSELTFKRDTEFRKQFFVPNSFAHPAKMDAQLLIWLVEHYTEPGQTILDPMFGSGTTMLACTLGRNVIGVELEQKFVDMAKQNWEKVQQRPQLGYAMGDCTILLGDARNLPQVLCDAIITSPPYEGTITQGGNTDAYKAKYGYQGENIGYAMPKADAIITSPPYEGSLELSSRHTKGGIPGRDAKLGQTGTYADVVISSPPYGIAETTGGLNTKPPQYDHQQSQRDPNSPSQIGAKEGYGKSEGQIANLPYGSIDAILTSPPYEGTDTKKGQDWWRAKAIATGRNPDSASASQIYSERGGIDNIGNLKAISYLQAMLTVYQNCYAVLKDGGLMVLVVKNFIRNKAEVDLRADTVKLAEQAGFTFLEEHYRKLTQQSFWRILYQRKYPEGPVIDKEYVLAFRKEV